jgi:hypothetical protein
VRPGQLLKAVGAVQEAQLLVARRAAPGEAGEAVRRDADLLGDEGQRLGRDQLAGSQQPPGVAERAELEGEAELGLGMLARRHARKVVFDEGEVLDEGSLARGQRQEIGALRVGEEASAGHRRSRAG